MSVFTVALAVVLGGLVAALPAHAQTTLTMSSWVSPQHHLSIWQANWTAEVEKALMLSDAPQVAAIGEHLIAVGRVAQRRR